MLDTNVCIELLRGRAGPMALRMREHDVDEIGISTVTLAELRYGAARSARPEHHEILLAQFCAPIAILVFDHAAAEAYGAVRAELERAGPPIGPLDTLIAGHACSLDLTFVTGNERDFRRVKHLRVENWLQQ